MRYRATIAVVMPCTVIAVLFCTGPLASGGTITVTDLGDSSVNLTTFGGADWKLWGVNDADLTPDEQKNGGSGIGALTYGGTGGPLGTANSSQSLQFSWTDGTPTASATNLDVNHLISPNEDSSAIYSTTIGASDTLNSLYVSYGQWNTTSRLQASLSDGSATPVIYDVSTNDHQTVRIDFASDLPSTLTVDVLFQADLGNSNSSLRFEGMALANEVAAAPVPEPSTFLMGGISLLGLAWLSRRKK